MGNINLLYKISTDKVCFVSLNVVTFYWATAWHIPIPIHYTLCPLGVI